MKNFSSNDPSKQDEPSITLQREEVTQVQAPGRHPRDTTQRKMTGNNDLFFLTNYHSLIASLSRLLGVHLRLHLLLIFFVNDNFFSKFLLNNRGLTVAQRLSPERNKMATGSRDWPGVPHCVGLVYLQKYILGQNSPPCCS